MLSKDDYRLYMTEDNGCTFAVIEKADWGAAILAMDVSDEDALKLFQDFLDGKEEPYEDENGVVWAESKEKLLPDCARFFGFREIDI